MTSTEMLARQEALLSAAKERGMNPDELAEFDMLQKSIEALGEKSMTQPEPTPAPILDERAIIENERARVRSITDICTQFEIDARSFIEDGSSIEAVNAAVLKTLAERKAPIATGQIVDVKDNSDDFVRAAADGLVKRAGFAVEKSESDLRPFLGRSIREIATDCMIRQGDITEREARSMNGDQIFERLCRSAFNPTALFPILLDNTIEKAVVAGYQQVPTTYREFTTKGTLSDFKIHDNNFTDGPAGEFEEIAENGEIKPDKYQFVKKPTRQLKSYAKSFSFTRQMFINDDVGAIARIPAKYAAAMETTINRQVYRMIVNNANIYDGTPLFSKEHKNLLASGTGITSDGVQSMILAFNHQTDDFGEPIVNTPAIMVLPVGLEFDIDKLFNSPQYSTPENDKATNPLYKYRSTFKIVEDPTINQMFAGNADAAVPWFMMSAPSTINCIEIDYLNGSEGLQSRRMEKAGQLGFFWDFWGDWNVQVMDYRGIIKNPGAKITAPIGLAK